MTVTEAATWTDLLDWRRRVQRQYAALHGLSVPERADRHAAFVQERERLFRTHPQSPVPPEARADRPLPYWPYDAGLAFTAALEAMPEERFVIPTSTGQDMPLVRFARLSLPFGTLDAYWIDVYGGGVFVPFRDRTSGRETYGGGRYLLDTVKGADLGSSPDGRLVLDFNFAYHPSCYYDHRWSCPLAPPANVLNVEIRAGERAPTPT